MTSPAVAMTSKQRLSRVKRLSRENAANRFEFSELIYRLKLDVEFHQSLGCETFKEFADTHLPMSYSMALKYVQVWEHFGIRLAGHFNPANPPDWSTLRELRSFTTTKNIRDWWKRAQTSLSYSEAKKVASEKRARLLGKKSDSLRNQQVTVALTSEGKRVFYEAVRVKMLDNPEITTIGEAATSCLKDWLASR